MAFASCGESSTSCWERRASAPKSSHPNPTSPSVSPRPCHPTPTKPLRHSASYCNQLESVSRIELPEGFEHQNQDQSMPEMGCSRLEDLSTRNLGANLLHERKHTEIPMQSFHFHQMLDVVRNHFLGEQNHLLLVLRKLRWHCMMGAGGTPAHSPPNLLEQKQDSRFARSSWLLQVSFAIHLRPNRPRSPLLAPSRDRYPTSLHPKSQAEQKMHAARAVGPA
mmetsp:Transcript_30203/g.72009  ORF Transcript_30203/g.72009 Transcript_30203/m.72009 type:complete len:222 (+) Transcript_30203:4717-5382(+)